MEIKDSKVIDQDMVKELMRVNSEHIFSHLPELFIASAIGALGIFVIRYIIPEKTWDGIKFKGLFLWLLSGIIVALCFIGFVNYIEKVDPVEERLKIVGKSANSLGRHF